MSKINDKHLREISVEFTKLNEYEDKKDDIRFTEVLIKILHLGRNYNGSIFKEKPVKKALPSLANTPILGYIEENTEGEDDFSDHRSIWVTDEDGNKSIRYAGNAYGVIPESFAKEAYFEDCLCSDGITRRYLFCKALLWNKFDYVLDIFNNSNGVVKQSMELADEYEGHWTKDGFEFDSFMFDGCCAISVEPAMIDSKIELSNFSANDIANEIKSKLSKYELLFASKDKEGEEVLDNEFAQKVNEEEVDTENKKKKCEKSEEENEVDTENKKNKCEKEENEDEVEIENKKKKCSKEEEEIEVENKKKKCEKSEEENEIDTENKKKKCEKETEVQEDLEDDEDPETDNKKKKCSKDEEENENSKKVEYKFALSHDDIRCSIYSKLYDLELIENDYFYIVSVYDNYFVYQSCATNKFYKQSYLISDNELSFNGERVEVFNVFVDENTYNEIQNVAYSKLKENYEAVQNELAVANGKIVKFEKENKELLEFKNNADEVSRKSEIDKIISNFSDMSGLDLELYRSKAYNKEFASNQDLENALYMELGKLNYSKANTQNNETKTVQTNYTVSLKENKSDENVLDYGAFNHIFQK